MSIALAGRPIVITGAGTGIGRATAVACAAAGMPVALAGRREAPLREVESAIAGAGGRAIVVPTDVADEAQCRVLVERTAQAFGSVYAAFANAGYGLRGCVHELSDRAIRDLIETNFWGSLYLLRPALAHMLDRGEGHLLMCSSCLSKIGTPFTAPYSASKAMQDHFGRAMRHELAPTGVHVSTIHPIGTRTEFIAAANRASGGSGSSLPPPRAFTQSPERVARAVVACLRKPHGEVWTSHTIRLAFAAATAFPGLTDWALARVIRRRDRSSAAAPPDGGS
ncbi:MAG: SDR family NAD(P)-dependent oxidoreductase [Phycisphaerales bacterium]|nr:SDR family NAD(P)-dependent oxidoreductase [Phycisphaerales bacterium]